MHAFRKISRREEVLPNGMMHDGLHIHTLLETHHFSTMYISAHCMLPYARACDRIESRAAVATPLLPNSTAGVTKMRVKMVTRDIAASSEHNTRARRNCQTCGQRICAKREFVVQQTREYVFSIDAMCVMRRARATNMTAFAHKQSISYQIVIGSH